MKQIEITVRLNESFESARNKLIEKGYRLIRESDIYDIYMTNKINGLNKENILEVIKKCVLLRSLKLDNQEIKKITYKNKEYDKNGYVVSEKKINLNCEDLNKAYNLFECLDFEKLIEVRYHVSVYEKDGREYAFQNVENLGTLIEYESLNDFEGKTLEEINIVKKEMYTEIVNDGIILTGELDVQKAKELVLKKL